MRPCLSLPWVRRLTAADRVLTCVYCGEAYPPGSPTHGAEVLTAHVRVCAKHPMREVESEVRRLREATRAAVERMKVAAVKAQREYEASEGPHRAMYCDGTLHGLREAVRMLEEEHAAR